jgi:putative Holliday junction resolvase
VSGGRVIGLDFGSKKIGVAVSDELRLTAHGLENVRARPAEEALEVLKQLVREYNAVEIVIGLPLNMDGTSGPGAEAARAFAARLTSELSVKVHLSDERLTTVMAEKTLLEANLSREKRKKLRDRIAAVLILQNFLDQGAHGE